MTLGESIKQMRKSRGLTQSELAELVNVSRSTVNRWERGRGKYDASNVRKVESNKVIPRADTLELLALALGCTIGELFGEEPAKEQAEKVDDIVITVSINGNTVMCWTNGGTTWQGR